MCGVDSDVTHYENAYIIWFWTRFTGENKRMILINHVLLGVP